ncbi:hypothetical protein Q9L58_002672 [Maublancomyces gigas]|uniref:PI31 proteasome regulator N-terminal domain-containing protein n=1 Tax=Discina gigas TaxID=1032678 RepID=A0ABR3GRX2_9PEZI
MAAIPFSAPTVLRNIDASLPAAAAAAAADDSPQLKTPHDAIAIFVHACMLSVGFRLIGLSEDDRLTTPIEGSSPQPLPASWNATPGAYGFRYAHAQSSLQYLLKVNRLGGKTVIMALGLGDDKTASFDVVTRDFLSESFFPYTLHTAPTSTTTTAQPLENAFISASRITDLATLFKINIVQKLIPGLSKPGYTEDPPAPASPPPQRHPAPNPYADPLRSAPPRNPYGDPLRYPPPRRPLVPGADRPPGFDDDYEVLVPPHGGGYGGRHPLSIGADDLGPPRLGPGGAPFFGGMHPTGDHPMFGGRGEGSGAQPGMRYDPVGPGDVPRGGLRGPRGPYGGGFGGEDGFGGGGFDPYGGRSGGGYGGYGGGDFI